MTGEERPFKAEDFSDAFSKKEAEIAAKVLNDNMDLLRRLAESDANAGTSKTSKDIELDAVQDDEHVAEMDGIAH